MKVYWYHRKDAATGRAAREWSYRLPADLRALPMESWPEGFKPNGTLYASMSASQLELEAVIQGAKLRAAQMAAGMPIISQNSIEKDIKDYLRWGATQNGKLDEGWAEGHSSHKRKYLQEWTQRLGLKSVADITFNAFDREISVLKADGLANNTVNNKAHALTGLTKFCKRRHRLAYDPLENWVSLKKVIKNPRGHFYPEELFQLFERTAPNNSITYQVAYYTRFREGELYDLRVESIHWTHGLMELPQQHTKNGKQAFQPLPDIFLPILWDYVQRRGLKPKDPLLDMSKNHPERQLYRDMEALGIPRIRDGKRRDFHAIGHSTATNMTLLGVSSATIQKGMRHGSLRQTLDYVSKEALPVRAAVNSLADALYPHTREQASRDFQHPGSTEEAALKLSPEAVEGYPMNARSPSPSARSANRPSTPAHNRAQERTPKNTRFSPSFRQHRTAAHTSFPDAREILARISHRVSEQAFADILRLLTDMPAAEVAQVLQGLVARRKVAG